MANSDGWTPLILALGSGHSEVVKLLLEKGADLTVAEQKLLDSILLILDSILPGI